MLEAQCPRRVSTAMWSLSPKSGYQSARTMFPALSRRSVPRRGIFRLDVSASHRSGYQSVRTIVPCITEAQCPSKGYLPPQYHLMFTFNAIARQSISSQGAVSLIGYLPP